MDNIGDVITEQLTSGSAEDKLRLKRLLRIWRDYYAEIFEVDVDTGRFDSLMDKTGNWPSKGFVSIEVMLLAEKRIHPDDRAAFTEFFDLDRIRRNVKEGIFVAKLYFRVKLDTVDDYIWVKAKNMIPSDTTGTDGIYMLTAFRKVERETSDDLRHKQELNDALDSAREASERKSELIGRLVREIKDPLNGIMGLSGMHDDSGIDALYDRLDRISEAALRLNESLAVLAGAGEPDEAEPVFKYTSRPVNEISYIGRESSEDGKENADGREEADVPEGFVFMSPYKGGAESDRQPKLDGRRFLLAENDRLNADVMKELLEKAGAAVDVVSDGKAAVIAFISKPAGTYSAVMMNLDLPVLDGCAAVRCIRLSGKEDAEDMRIYAVTSHGEKSVIRKAYEQGFNAYFTKPLDFNLIFEKLAENFS